MLLTGSALRHYGTLFTNEVDVEAQARDLDQYVCTPCTTVIRNRCSTDCLRVICCCFAAGFFIGATYLAIGTPIGEDGYESQRINEVDILVGCGILSAVASLATCVFGCSCLDPLDEGYEED